MEEKVSAFNDSQNSRQTESGSSGISFPARHNPFPQAEAAFDAPVQLYTGEGKLIVTDKEKGILKVRDKDSTEYELLVDRVINSWIHPNLENTTVEYKLKDEKSDKAIVDIPWHLKQHKEDIEKPSKHLPKHIGSETELGGILATGHSIAFGKNRASRTLANSVIGGSFTGKRDQRGQIHVENGDEKENQALDDLKDEVKTFYEITDQLRKDYQDAFAASRVKHITVYRAVATSNRDQVTFVESLPSSASFSLDFVKDWTKNRGKENYIIFEISVPVTHNMLVLAYPENYTLQYPKPLNQKQAEVTLAPTTLTKTSSRNDDGYFIAKANAVMMSAAIAQTTIQDQSDQRGEDITLAMLEPVFDGIKTFFTKAQLVKAYEDWNENWADLISEQAVTSKYAKKVTFSLEGSEQEFVAEMSLDEQTGEIKIAMTTWTEDYSFDLDTDDEEEELEMEEEEEEEQEAKVVQKTINRNYTKKTIGSIFSVAKSGRLDQSEAYEYIDWPSDWENFSG